MRVAIYARVSSERQAEKDLSIPAQIKALKRYAFGRQWDVVAEYVDEAESARSANRPAFKEMIAAAKSSVKPFDAILVWKLSRFARNREDSVVYKSLLKRQRISVVSMNEQVDESPAGLLLEGMIEVIDEFYSANLSQDTVRGMKENAARGFRNGGSTPFGYRRVTEPQGAVSKSRLVPDEREASIVARVFDLAVHGQGAREIAGSLNREGLRTRSGKHFAATVVNQMLRNEAYVGTLVWNKYAKGLGGKQKKPEAEVIRVPDSHGALVDRHVFDQVQGMLTARRPSVKHPMRVSSRYLLSGLAHCARCGSTAVGTNGKSGRFLYYSCNSRIMKGTTACDAPSMNAGKLEAFVVDRIRENILTEENLGQLAKLANEELGVSRRRAEKRIEGLEQERGSVDQKLARLYVALESGKVEIDDLAPRLKELRAEHRELGERMDEALNDLAQAGHEPIDPVVMEEYVADLQNLLRSASLMECKAFLASFVRRVEYDRQQVSIEYTVPVALDNGSTGATAVRNVDSNGTPARTRTGASGLGNRCSIRLSYRGTDTKRGSRGLARPSWHSTEDLAPVQSAFGLWGSTFLECARGGSVTVASHEPSYLTQPASQLRHQ